MYVRTKTFKNKDGSTRTYLYIVEGRRVNGKVRQEIVANLGRLEELQEKGLDQIIEGLVKFSKKQWIQMQARALEAKWAKELGPALVFRRLWEDLDLSRMLWKFQNATQLTINIDEAVFAMVLNRLCEPQSKFGVTKWIKNVYRPQFEQLELHHFYRSLDFVAEHKDQLEVGLFDRIKNLFNVELDLVFWDTTTIYFEGKGAEGLAAYGFSKDNRPDRVQIVIGVLMTRDGTPVAHQVFPGNTADVETFRAALTALKKRFNIRRVIMVGDRGMVSREIIEEITTSGMEYIVGVKMRKLKQMAAVLSRAGRYRKVKDNLKVKEVKHQGIRYVVCYNPEEAAHDAKARAEMVAKLEQKLQTGGLKSLIGNSGYRRYLKVSGAKATIDRQTLKEEARFDGKYVLQTNTQLSAGEVALAYKGLWQVERAFRELKSGLDLRPVYHWTPSRIIGHVAVCFLAFVMEVALRKKLKETGIEASYRDILSDLTQLKAVQIIQDGQTYLARTELQGKAYDAFKAVGLRPPAKVQVMPPAEHTG